jgi:2-keto-myo-inositol isomerase
MSPALQPPFAGIALHTWTVDTTPLAEALAAAKAGGCDAVELRRIDFKRCFEAGLDNEQVLDLVRAGDVQVCTLGVEYGWVFATGEESDRLFEVFAQSCRNAVALGCGMVMSAPGPFVGPLADGIENLKRAADIAGEHGLRLAFEFNSQHDVINHVTVLADLVHGAGRANAGMLLDAYHLHRSGRPGRGFEDVDGADIFAFQFSDVAPKPVTGVKRPTDRLAPGEGQVRWAELFGLLAEKNFRGFLSYEAPNPVLWNKPAIDTVREGVEATRRLLDQTFSAASSAA